MLAIITFVFSFCKSVLYCFILSTLKDYFNYLHYTMRTLLIPSTKIDKTVSNQEVSYFNLIERTFL